MGWVGCGIWWVGLVWVVTRVHICAWQVFADGSAEEKLRAMFRMYDIDRNGYVTVDEIAKILGVRRSH